MTRPNRYSIKRWWAANAKDILKIMTIFLIGLIVMMFVSLAQEQNRSDKAQISQSGANARILRELAKQAKVRSDNVNKLIKDNAEQTLILCTIILRDNTRLTAAEVDNIQTICHEQISRISNDLDASSSPSTSGGTPQSVSGTGASSPQSAPTPTSGQPNNVQTPPVTPKPGVVKRLTDDTTNFVCGVPLVGRLCN